MEANKARNMIIHREEIQSRPPRVWFQDESGKHNKNISSNVGTVGYFNEVMTLKKTKKLLYCICNKISLKPVFHLANLFARTSKKRM